MLNRHYTHHHINERSRLFIDSQRRGCHNSCVDNATVAVLVFLLSLTSVSAAVSINILLRGRIWQRLKPSSRPRRWVLIWLLISLFLTFVWLPVFVERPDTQLAKVLTVLWAISFIGMGLVFKFPPLSSAVDMIFERNGWPLR
jgi:hypothetical protein